MMFGIIFLVAGIAVAYMTFIKMTSQYLSSEDWQSVPAKILSLDLVVTTGDSTTYRVDATYTYVFQGESYQSNKVSFSTASDNVGNYWQDLHRRLETQRSNGRMFALVNQDNPNESVLDRTFRWAQVAFGGMFLVMFSGAGLAVVWFSMKAGKTQQQVVEESEAGIASNQKNGFWFMFLFGCVFFLIGSFTFAMVLPEIINNGEYAALFTLLFVVVGGGIMAFSLTSRRRYKLIGPSPLFLDPLPGVIGGHVGGMFEIACMVLDSPLNITLTCQRRIKSGKNTRINVLWQESMQAYGTQISKGMNMRFLFDCPPDLPEGGIDGVEWQLEAQGEVTKKSNTVKFSRSWFIPVFSDTAKPQSTITIPAQFIDQQTQAKAQAAKISAAELMQLNQQGQYLNIELTAGRPVVGSLLGALFGLIFGGAGLFTISEGWWPGYLFVVIGFLAVLGALFVLGREIDVKIDTQIRILHMRRKWFGIVLYKREVMLLEPSQLTIKKSSTTTSGSKRTEYYVVNIDNNGKKVVLAEAIEGKDVAQAVKEEIIERAFSSRF